MLQIVAEVVLYVAFAATGRCALWLVTFGRWRAFDRGHDEATIAGVLFWVVIGVGIWVVSCR